MFIALHQFSVSLLVDTQAWYETGQLIQVRDCTAIQPTEYRTVYVALV